MQINDDDGLPLKICFTCLDEIKQIQKFIKQFRESDTKLRLYREGSIHIEPGDITSNISDELYDQTNDFTSETKTKEQNYVDLKYEDEKFYSDDENEKIKKEYLCDICNKVLKTKKLLFKHKHCHLTNNRKHVCGECGKEFLENTYLKVHMRSHFTDDEKPYKCQQCGQQYAYQYQLTQHLYKHSDQKPFPCPRCNKGRFQ